MGKKIIRTLGQTLQRLIGEGQRFSKLEALALRSGVGKSTIARARNGENAIRVDNLADIAKAYNLEPWQLLVENVDPTNPPKLEGDASQETAWPFVGIISAHDYRQLPDDVKNAIREYAEMKVKNNQHTFRRREAS